MTGKNCKRVYKIGYVCFMFVYITLQLEAAEKQTEADIDFAPITLGQSQINQELVPDHESNDYREQIKSLNSEGKEGTSFVNLDNCYHYQWGMAARSYFD